MGLERIPQAVRDRYHVDERGHASAILASDYPDEFQDIMDCLAGFVLRKISAALDDFLQGRGWREKSFDIKIAIDGNPVPIPTHKIDDFKNEVGLEVEWNNKTEFYDRDLNNFRLLKELRVLAVGVMITRMSELQILFNRLGKGTSYGASTTHWDKLIPKVDGGGAGGCPLLLVGMGMNCYDPDS
jgi:hypothetical protein